MFLELSRTSPLSGSNLSNDLLETATVSACCGFCQSCRNCCHPKTSKDMAKRRPLPPPGVRASRVLKPAFEGSQTPAGHRREPSFVAGLLRSDRSDHESRSRENGLRDRDAPQHADSGPSNGHRIAAIGQMPPQSTA